MCVALGTAYLAIQCLCFTRHSTPPRERRWALAALGVGSWASALAALQALTAETASCMKVPVVQTYDVRMVAAGLLASLILAGFYLRALARPGAFPILAWPWFVACLAASQGALFASLRSPHVVETPWNVIGMAGLGLVSSAVAACAFALSSSDRCRGYRRAAASTLLGITASGGFLAAIGRTSLDCPTSVNAPLVQLSDLGGAGLAASSAALLFAALLVGQTYLLHRRRPHAPQLAGAARAARETLTHVVTSGKALERQLTAGPGALDGLLGSSARLQQTLGELEVLATLEARLGSLDLEYTDMAALLSAEVARIRQDGCDVRLVVAAERCPRATLAVDRVLMAWALRGILRSVARSDASPCKVAVSLGRDADRLRITFATPGERARPQPSTFAAAVADAHGGVLRPLPGGGELELTLPCGVADK
jgi:hypothetical protein